MTTVGCSGDSATDTSRATQNEVAATKAYEPSELDRLPDDETPIEQSKLTDEDKPTEPDRLTEQAALTEPKTPTAPSVVIEKVTLAETAKPRFSEKVISMLKTAKETAATGDFDKAIVELNELLQIEPEFIEALQTRAEMHRLRNEKPMAIKDLKAAAELEPDSSPILIQLARVQIEVEDFKSAIETATNATSLDASDANAVAILSWAEIAQLNSKMARRRSETTTSYIKLLAPANQRLEDAMLTAEKLPNGKRKADIYWYAGSAKTDYGLGLASVLKPMEMDEYRPKLTATLGDALTAFEHAVESDPLHLDGHESIVVLGFYGGVDLAKGMQSLVRLVEISPKVGESMLNQLVVRCWTTDMLDEPEKSAVCIQALTVCHEHCEETIRESLNEVEKLWKQANYASSRIAATGYVDQKTQDTLRRLNRAKAVYNAVLANTDEQE